MSLFVENCDEKFFTNEEKCSIIIIVLVKQHESVFKSKKFFRKNYSKKKIKKGGEKYELCYTPKDMLIL